MKRKINLTYLLSTYNKLPYLRQALKYLLPQVEADEEVIVIDGGSTDGSKEYLTKLYQAGKIHQLVSEKDHGEPHAYNKGLLMARGQLVKLLTDDDIFNYPAIKACKTFMLQNHQIDVTMGDLIEIYFQQLHEFIKLSDPLERFQKWRTTSQPFPTCGIVLMLRRSQLPLLGLLNTAISITDTEYTLRLSTVANLAFYTLPIGVHLTNSQSNFARMARSKADNEYRKIAALYSWSPQIPQGMPKPIFKLKQQLKQWSFLISEALLKTSPKINRTDSKYSQVTLEDIWKSSTDWLKKENKRQGKFLTKTKYKFGKILDKDRLH